MGLALLSEHRGPLSGASFWKCVDDAELKPVTEEIADRLASSPRLALAHAKRAIYASGANSFDEQLNLERDLLRELGKTPEYRAAVAAFLEKRGRPRRIRRLPETNKRGARAARPVSVYDSRVAIAVNAVVTVADAHPVPQRRHSLTRCLDRRSL